VKDLNPVNFKKNMAIVQQEPVLFSGTIRENIVYGLDFEPSKEELDQACAQANALAFIREESIFPLGYDTVVGERGIKLSGGQKQRIAIARAMIRKPKVLLLDEATSALDAESEHQVQLALDKVLTADNSSQTVVVIAHRLSTIKDADEILVLNKGLVVEKGTHDELVELGGAYKKLVER
jgi:ABC-type multidrug transport system fused ATPase/permease subunit